MKFVSTIEAAVRLETTVNVIWVTACHWRKKHGEYPCWYKSVNKESFVDIDYIFELRDRETKMRQDAVELYYLITEDMKMRPTKLVEKLAENSEIYTIKASWHGFIYGALFGEPVMKFHDRVTRLSEFHRITTQIKDEYDTNRR